MLKRNKIKLDKSLFWDVDFKNLDLNKNKQFIVGRVLLYGDIDDYKEIREFYGLQKLKNIAKKVKYLDRKSLNFWSFILKIPKNKFVCSQTSLKQKQDPFLNRLTN
ncbi:MAG: hypothetical protein ABIF17_00230 [Patescibacteria group bacterium]